MIDRRGLERGVERALGPDERATDPVSQGLADTPSSAHFVASKDLPTSKRPPESAVGTVIVYDGIDRHVAELYKELTPLGAKVVRALKSRDDWEALLKEYQGKRISHLVVITHGTLVGATSIKLLPDPPILLLPAIDKVSFEACDVGRIPEWVQKFSANYNVPVVKASKKLHYLGWMTFDGRRSAHFGGSKSPLSFREAVEIYGQFMHPLSIPRFNAYVHGNSSDRAEFLIEWFLDEYITQLPHERRREERNKFQSRNEDFILTVTRETRKKD